MATPYDHPSLLPSLRTIEDAFGISSHLNLSACITPTAADRARHDWHD